MNKVVTIHLDGIAYQLEEGAYDALRAYLDAANAKLAQNPDKDEIGSAVEQAIGAKLRTYLSSHKNVLTQSDVDVVLAEMGPVAEAGDAEDGEGIAGASDATVHKRLYRISEGRVIAGVCTGLAAYFTVDVTLVRILFVILTVLFHGIGILIYIIMVLIVPRARTPKDYEEASGIPPVTAQELVDRAKKSIDDFKTSGEWQSWRSNWKDQRRAWKHQHKAWKRAQKQQWKAQQYVYGHPKTFLSELSEFIWSMFGLVVIIFVVWFLYHHVGLVQQFIDFMHRTWDSFFYSLTQATGNK